MGDRTGPPDDVVVGVETLPVLSWALARAGIPLVSRLTLTPACGPVRGARVHLTVGSAAGPLGEPVELVADLGPGATVLVDVGLRLDAGAMAGVHGTRPGTVEVRVTAGGRELGRTVVDVRVLAADAWLASPAPLALETLAAHVRPADPALATLVGAATDLLEGRTGDHPVTAAPPGPDRVDGRAAAIVEAVRRRGIRLEPTPADWAGTAQRVRTPTEVLDDRVGSCLDTAVVVAAAFEQAGIRPLLWVAAGGGAGRGHAFVGYWRVPGSAASVATTSVEGLVELVESGAIQLVDTMMLTADAEPATFGDLHRTPHAAWLTGDRAGVLGVTDVHRARLDGVRPLPAGGPGPAPQPSPGTTDGPVPARLTLVPAGGPDVAGHPLVDALADGRPGAFTGGPLPTVAVEVLDELAGTLPLPADSAQLRAVAAAVAGHTVVLEAAPGTGASQTIANLVARSVADGRRVLVVADAGPALDDLAGRLAAVGLGPLVGDLRTAAVRAPRTAARHVRAVGPGGRPAHSDELRDLGRRLADSARRLHEPNSAGLSLYAARCGVLPTGASPSLPVPTSFAANASVRTVGAVRDVLAALPAVAARAEPRPGHPWGFLDRPDVDPVAVAAAVVAVDRAVDGLPTEGPLADVLAAARTADELGSLAAVLADLTTGRPVPLEVLDETRTPAWAAAADTVLRAGTAFRVATHPGLDVAAPEVLDLPLADLAEAAQEAAASGRLGRTRRLTDVLDQLSPTLRPGARVAPAEVPALLADLLEVQAAAQALAARAAQLPGVRVPPTWNPLTDPSLVGRQVSRLRRLGAAAARPAPFTTALRRFLLTGPSAATRTVAAVGRARDALTDLSPACAAPPEQLAAWAGDAGFLPQWSATRAGRAIETYGLPSLQAWRELLTGSELLRAAGLDAARAALLSGAVPAADAGAAVDRGLARASVEERQAATGLDAGAAAALEAATRRFPAAAAEARAAVVAGLAERAAGSGHPTAGSAPAARPCVLADPASVATLLPADAPPFDVVVVEGAGRLRAADVIGALGRAGSAVVVGDRRQLPPPSGGAPAADSLLEDCLRAGVPRLELTWHHRSADETLFAFSNAHHYGGRISSFPGPVGGGAVSLVRVAGTFHRDGSLPATNPAEARAVVAEVRRRVDVGPVSLAVVTLHPAQGALVERLLRDTGDERVTAALDSGSLVVAHLDDAQGVVRDVVLLSLGCSAPRGGSVPGDLGPLARAGGERWLNVAVTRARRQVVVYASFDPEQLRAEETSALGVRQLRAYLDLAAGGTDAVPRTGGGLDAHREEVAAALRARGLSVCTDLGLSAFRVDLAVARPTDPAAPVLAVLLDGPAWASRGTVTDRDGMPVEALRGLPGWPAVERVTLVSWLADPAAVLDRLVAVAAGAGRAPAAPPAPLPAAAAAPLVVEPPSVAVPAVTVPAGAVAVPAAEVERGTQEPVRVLSRPAVPVRVTARPAVPPVALTGERPFVPWTPKPAGEPLVFRRMTDPEVARQVRRVLAAGIAAEGPVHRERLARLAAGAFGVARVNEARRESILALLPDPSAEYRWPKGLDPATWTGFRRQSSSAERPLEQVHPDEIGNAMVALCRAGDGMTRDELFARTLAVFGHRRRHPVLLPLLEVALAHAVRASRVTREPAGRLISAA